MIILRSGLSEGKKSSPLRALARAGSLGAVVLGENSVLLVPHLLFPASLVSLHQSLAGWEMSCGGWILGTAGCVGQELPEARSDFPEKAKDVYVLWRLNSPLSLPPHLLLPTRCTSNGCRFKDSCDLGLWTGKPRHVKLWVFFQNLPQILCLATHWHWQHFQ